MVTPAERRTVVTYARATAGLSERGVCRDLGALLRYQPRRPEEAALRALAARKRRGGVPRLCWRLRREGWRVNYKRLAWLCREAGLTLTGACVVAALEHLAATRGLLRTISVDHGTEFTSRALDAWAEQRGVALDCIRPGQPNDNVFSESFNSRLRDECLNEHWFHTLAVEDHRHWFVGRPPRTHYQHLHFTHVHFPPRVTAPIAT
jgi:transposase InsO family protein